MAEIELNSLQVARFTKLPPQAAVEALKERNERRKAQNPYDCDFTEVEQALLARRDPLVDLGLAQYGLTREVLIDLYQRSLQSTGDAAQDLGIRVAILSNQLAPGRFFEDNPAMSAEELQRLATDGTNDEIKALLTNPMTRTYVGSLYRRKAPFDALGDDRFHTLVRASVDNVRLYFSDDTADGPDLHHMDIHSGIYQMLATVPTTHHWLWTLDYLLFNYLPASTYGQKDVLEVIQRWRPVELKKFNSEEDEIGHYTDLKMAEEFCCRLAAVFGGYYEDGQSKCIGNKDSLDIVLRCAYYGNDMKMTPAEMKAAFDKDGEVFVFAALHNSHFYWNKACRATLEPMLRGYQTDLYATFCKKKAEREKNFDAKPISDDFAFEEEETPQEEPWTQFKLTLANIEARAASAQKNASMAKSLGIWILILVVAVLWHMK
jgi:hypothetical protein